MNLQLQPLHLVLSALDLSEFSRVLVHLASSETTLLFTQFVDSDTCIKQVLSSLHLSCSMLSMFPSHCPCSTHIAVSSGALSVGFMHYL